MSTLAIEPEMFGEFDEAEAHCPVCGRSAPAVLEGEDGSAPFLRSMERGVLLAKMASGERDPGKLANEIFYLRHPTRRGTKLAAHEQALIDEWKQIRARVVLPVLLAGPSEGPIHGRPRGSIGSPLLKIAPDAVISPLAIAPRGLRRQRVKMSRVAQIVVHTTSRGPANRSIAAKFRRPAVDYAVDYYVTGDGGYPHYVVDFNGTIHATADERYQAAHAGWVHQGGARHFVSNWKAPKWWSDVWSPFAAKSPLHLLPTGARSPNAQSIGVELLILPDLGYTDAQYVSLAKLVKDVQRRHGLAIPSAPSKQLLGHEDYAPVTLEGGRANSGGGWDPGAHRTKPYFSWQRVWSEMQKA
jgi:hypothetical protein